MIKNINIPKETPSFFLRKTLVSAILIGCSMQVSPVFSDVQVFNDSSVNATTPSEVDTIAVDEILGSSSETGDTLFLDVGTDEFILSQKEWYVIQAYTDSALALPTTQASLESALLFGDSVEFDSHYQGLLEEYVAIHDTGKDWNTNIYPSIVDLALQLSNYKDIHLIFLKPLVDQLSAVSNGLISATFIEATFGKESQEYADAIQEVRSNFPAIKSYLNILNVFSSARMADALNAKESLATFATDLKDQSLSLDVYNDTFSDLLNLDNTESMRNRIDEINLEIQAINDEIAKKKRDVGLTAIGGGISLLIGGSILGSQIQALKDEISSLKSEKEGLQGDLAHAVALYESYEHATISIRQIDEKIEAAEPYVDKVMLAWQELTGVFVSLNTAIVSAEGPNGIENLDTAIAGFSTAGFVTVAESNWENISNKAKAFAQNAYVNSID